MSSRSPRWVEVDDTDTSIQYSGPWVQADASIYDGQGNFGATYKQSLHGTTGVASLSYAFNGTGAAIYGTNYINNSTGVVDPVWQCFMDGISSGTYGPFPYPENNWVFCQWDSIPDGPHIMSVNATSKGQTFLFDVLRYSPTDGASINGGAIVFDHIDPDIYFDSQWGALEGTATMTTTMGATMTLDFFGTNLTWYATIPVELPHGPTTATYTVDNHSAVTFTLPGLPNANNGTATQYNQKVFQTTPLALGNHTLKVIHQGNSSLTPLVLKYLIIQNQTNSAPEIISSGYTSKGPPVGAIVGGAIGAVSALILSTVIYLVVRHRRKRRANANAVINDNDIVDPFFTAPPSQLDTSIYGTSVLPVSQHKRTPLASFSNNTGITTSTSSSGFGNYSSSGTRRQVASPAIVASGSDGEPHPPLATARRIVHHQDSGFRLPNTEVEEVVEVPPNYTPA